MKREEKTGKAVILGERKKERRGGWLCEAEVAGVKYEVWLIVLRNGTPQPDTWGAVRRVGVTGPSVWEERVLASIEPKEILRLAGILDGTAKTVAEAPGPAAEGDSTADPLAALRGKFKIEESRINQRDGSRVRSELLTVTCDRCTTCWTIQIKADGQAHPDMIQRLLDHHGGHAPV